MKKRIHGHKFYYLNIFMVVSFLFFISGESLLVGGAHKTLFLLKSANAQAPLKNNNKGVTKVDKNKSTKNNSENNLSFDPEDDPTLFTDNEIKVLQQLAGRRDLIEARAEELRIREGLLGAAEKRIDKKILEMRRLELAIKKLIKTHDRQEDLKMQSLVKIYEAMKPKDAARIFGELDINTLLMVAERMKERKLAPIMAQMNPERAKEMTVELTRIRNLPDSGT
jgi:flagellar motility protein MotE (MotC chaperone)